MLDLLLDELARTFYCTSSRYQHQQLSPMLEHKSISEALTPVSCLDRLIHAPEVDLNDLTTSSSSTCSRPDQVIPALQPLDVDGTKFDTRDYLEKETKAHHAATHLSLSAPNGQTGPSPSLSIAQCDGFEGNQGDGMGSADPSGHIYMGPMGPVEAQSSTTTQANESNRVTTSTRTTSVSEEERTTTSNRVTTSTRTTSVYEEEELPHKQQANEGNTQTATVTQGENSTPQDWRNTTSPDTQTATVAQANTRNQQGENSTTQNWCNTTSLVTIKNPAQETTCLPTEAKNLWKQIQDAFGGKDTQGTHYTPDHHGKETLGTPYESLAKLIRATLHTAWDNKCASPPQSLHGQPISANNDTKTALQLQAHQNSDVTSLSIGEVFKDPHRETPSFEEGIRREDTVPLSMATKGLKLQTRNDHENSTGKANKPRKTIHYSSPAKDRAHTLKGSHEEVKKARLKSEGPDFQFYASTSAVKLATENAARSQSQTVEACLNKNRGDLEAKGSSLSITAPSFEAAGLHNPLRGLASASCATAESAPTHIDEMDTPSHNIHESLETSSPSKLTAPS